jgi:transcriptional regulator with XRE-family HTH domain
MPAKKRRIDQPEIVHLFAARLRERRLGTGLTQIELAERAEVTPTYVGRLESAGAAPGIDTVARLAAALGTTVHDLLPLTTPPDTLALLKERGRALFNEMLQKTDRELMQLVVPLLAKLVEAPARTH